MWWVARIPATRVNICLQALVVLPSVSRLLRHRKVQIGLLQFRLVDLYRSMSLAPRGAFLSHCHNLFFIFLLAPSHGKFRGHWHVLAVDGFKHCGILINLLHDRVNLLLARGCTCLPRLELVGRAGDWRLLSLA